MARRRDLLLGAGLISAGAVGLARGDAYAKAVDDAASLYDLDRSLANFDAAYYGAMTREVRAEYVSQLDWVNRHNSAYLRGAVAGRSEEDDLRGVRKAVGALIGASPDEIGLSGGGTEALYALIVNSARLGPGDQILWADVDYDEMQHAMAYLAKVRGAESVRLSLPEPSTAEAILEAYGKAFRAHPRAKLLLLTHVSNRHGLVPPVREIIALAKAHGLDVILDSAQAVGQFPFSVDELGADFVGFSLHKWLGAPLGVGGVYIRQSRLGDIAPWLGNHIFDDDDIRARLPTGTVDYAARLTIPKAIAVHLRLGPEAKFAHLIAQRDVWIDRVRQIAGIEIVSPNDTNVKSAIAAFRLPNMRGIEDTRRAQQVFLHKHKVLVVAKAGLASGPVLRVTPGLYTTPAELDLLVGAIESERAMFG